ncbi:MAG: hypothetical protein ING36_15790 [Burkholderiales bacterium]|nr:hypothetical protein [Burkholderiales bacterium]MCA3176968.1 hypothetical protein [Burkholderiales bacterium]
MIVESVFGLLVTLFKLGLLSLVFFLASDLALVHFKRDADAPVNKVKTTQKAAPAAVPGKPENRSQKQ